MSVAYDKDFYGWVNEQAQLIKSGALAQLDVDNLLEEVESMGRSELEQLETRLELLVMHLLKWRFQSDRQSRSWLLTIKEQRQRINRLISRSPSIKHPMSQEGFLDSVWEYAIVQAAKETGFEESMFPATPIRPLVEIVDLDFLP